LQHKQLTGVGQNGGVGVCANRMFVDKRAQHADIKHVHACAIDHDRCTVDDIATAMQLKETSASSIRHSSANKVGHTLFVLNEKETLAESYTNATNDLINVNSCICGCNLTEASNNNNVIIPSECMQQQSTWTVSAEHGRVILIHILLREFDDTIDDVSTTNNVLIIRDGAEHDSQLIYTSFDENIQRTELWSSGRSVRIEWKRSQQANIDNETGVLENNQNNVQRQVIVEFHFTGTSL
jgi:hypothetical protein